MPKTLMQRNENYAKHLPEMKEKDQGRKEKNGEKAALNASHYLLQYLASLRIFRNMSHP